MAYRTSKETQLRKDEKKEYIIRTAARLFAERGYRRTTVKAIVEATQTSVGTFYFYFANKELLFEELYDRMEQVMDQVSDFALERSRGMIKGFCYSKTAELWAYQNFHGLARTMMVEAAGMHPRFERKRAEIIDRANQRIEVVFARIKQDGTLNIPDPKMAALLCNGTMFSVIMDWLQKEADSKLTDYTFPIITFNLNAFKIEYTNQEVINNIQEILVELEKDAKFAFTLEQ